MNPLSGMNLTRLDTVSYRQQRFPLGWLQTASSPPLKELIVRLVFLRTGLSSTSRCTSASVDPIDRVAVIPISECGTRRHNRIATTNGRTSRAIKCCLWTPT